MTNCPHCRGELRIIKPDRARTLTLRSESASFIGKGDAVRTVPPPTLLEEPARTPGLLSDIVVPLGQATLTGGLIALTAATVGSVAGWPGGDVVLIIGTSAATLYWLGAMRDMRRLLWRVEEWIGADIDKDGHAGPPPDPGVVVIDGAKVARRAELTEAEKWRDDAVRLVELVHARQVSGRPAGQKALRGHRLRHRDCTDEFHRDVGERLRRAGLAKRSGKGWQLLATPEDVRGAVGVW